jgi:hypothetical protein
MGTITVAPALTQSDPTAQTICYGASVTFSLAAASGGSGTISYTWQQSSNNSTWTNASGTNNTAVYTTPALTSDMWYRRIATGATCGAATSTSAKVTVRTNFSAGTITSTTVTTVAGSAPTTNPTNATQASGGNGSITYEWRRTGTSSKTLTNSNTYSYNISLDGTNYSTAGTYHFTRYAKDNTCKTTFAASTGLYSLTVGPTYPPGAENKTWTCGDLVWSAEIKSDTPDCVKVSTAGITGTRPEYLVGTSGYWYNALCVAQYPASLCPPPWRIPTRNEYSTITSCFSASALRNMWKVSGFLTGASATETNQLKNYTSTHQGTNQLYYFGVDQDNTTRFGYLNPLDCTLVRCVRDM